MHRRACDLVASDLNSLPRTVRECAHWETPASVFADSAIEQRAATKAGWINMVQAEWGTCGQTLWGDDQPIGVILYAPAFLVPGTAAMPTAPLTPSAVQFTSIWVAQQYRGRGSGKLLVHAMLRDLLKRNCTDVVEVIGAVREPSTHSAQNCAVPASFLETMGFEMQRAHPTFPRYRMNLRSVLTWREELGRRWRGLAVAVRPSVLSPEPERIAARLSDDA